MQKIILLYELVQLYCTVSDFSSRDVSIKMSWRLGFPGHYGPEVSSIGVVSDCSYQPSPMLVRDTAAFNASRGESTTVTGSARVPPFEVGESLLSPPLSRAVTHWSVRRAPSATRTTGVLPHRPHSERVQCSPRCLTCSPPLHPAFLSHVALCTAICRTGTRGTPTLGQAAASESVPVTTTRRHQSERCRVELHCTR